MNLKQLEKEYDKLQIKYGDKNLDSIYNGGCSNNPDICFVFMNPTKRNIACLLYTSSNHYTWSNWFRIRNYRFIT